MVDIGHVKYSDGPYPSSATVLWRVRFSGGHNDGVLTFNLRRVLNSGEFISLASGILRARWPELRNKKSPEKKASLPFLMFYYSTVTGEKGQPDHCQLLIVETETFSISKVLLDPHLYEDYLGGSFPENLVD